VPELPPAPPPSVQFRTSSSRKGPAAALVLSVDCADLETFFYSGEAIFRSMFFRRPTSPPRPLILMAQPLRAHYGAR